MTSSVFPDINVWIAVSYPGHSHFAAARSWYGALPSDVVLVLCRHTQLGWFRLMTTEAVMGNQARTQRQCWAIYRSWIDAGRAVLLADPAGVDAEFEHLASADAASPKQWADAYLAAFAEAAGTTLVTFDRALAERAERAVLLG
jgi:toxin-antitoxin system PIN domain toxin